MQQMGLGKICVDIRHALFFAFGLAASPYATYNLGLKYDAIPEGRA